MLSSGDTFLARIVLLSCNLTQKNVTSPSEDIVQDTKGKHFILHFSFRAEQQLPEEEE